MALRITNDNDGLETGTLTGTGLFLDGLDLFPIISVSVSKAVHFSHLDCARDL